MVNVSRSAKPGKTFRRSIIEGIVMRKFFFAAAAAAAAMLLAESAFAQTFIAPIEPQRPIQPAPRPPPTINPREAQGVVPRAVRGGNPAQMLNPGAPARYGTAEQSVTLKPDGSGKWNGIKLFEIVF
jgi:hypothetical protein